MFSVNRLFRIYNHGLFYVCSFDQLVKTRTKLEQIGDKQRVNSRQIGGKLCWLVTLPENRFRLSAGLFSGCRIGEGQMSYPYSPDVYPMGQVQLYERIGLYDWIGRVYTKGYRAIRKDSVPTQRDRGWVFIYNESSDGIHKSIRTDM